MKGKVLISEPFLADPNFSRSVILITEHNAKGSFGFVLNQKTDLMANAILEELHLVNQAVYSGGPVDPQSFHCLHTYGHIQDAIYVCENVYWGGDFKQIFEQIKQHARQKIPKKKLVLILDEFSGINSYESNHISGIKVKKKIEKLKRRLALLKMKYIGSAIKAFQLYLYCWLLNFLILKKIQPHPMLQKPFVV